MSFFLYFFLVVGGGGGEGERESEKCERCCRMGCLPGVFLLPLVKFHSKSTLVFLIWPVGGDSHIECEWNFNETNFSRIDNVICCLVRLNSFFATNYISRLLIKILFCWKEGKNSLMMSSMSFVVARVSERKKMWNNKRRSLSVGEIVCKRNFFFSCFPVSIYLINIAF